MRQQMIRAFDLDQQGGSKYEQRLRTRIESLRRSLRKEFGESLQLLASQTQQQANGQLAQAMTALRTDIEQNGTKIGQHDESIHKISRRIVRVNGRIRQVNESIQKVTDVLGDKRFAQIINQQDELHDAQQRAIDQIAQIARYAYDTAEQMLHDTQQASGEISDNAQRIIAQVGRYDEEIRRHENTLDALQAGIEELRRDFDPDSLTATTLHELAEYLNRYRLPRIGSNQQ